MVHPVLKPRIVSQDLNEPSAHRIDHILLLLILQAVLFINDVAYFVPHQDAAVGGLLFNDRFIKNYELLPSVVASLIISDLQELLLTAESYGQAADLELTG
ncbi:hypothetical protein CMI47_05910 [Candidatus Pacearchaeota archaeon]|nr:hypothetical protein [Candidatus Pacearchaeota archaeon]